MIQFNSLQCSHDLHLTYLISHPEFMPVDDSFYVYKSSQNLGGSQCSTIGVVCVILIALACACGFMAMYRAAKGYPVLRLSLAGVFLYLITSPLWYTFCYREMQTNYSSFFTSFGAAGETAPLAIGR